MYARIVTLQKKVRLRIKYFAAFCYENKAKTSNQSLRLKLENYPEIQI